MMAVLESNTGQTRPNTGINTEAPEIEGWKRRKGETASSITQGGQDTLELEGTRDAEAKVFATMVEVPEVDNKVTATTGDTKTDLQDMEGGSGTTAIDSGKLNNINDLVIADPRFLNANGEVDWEKFAPNGGYVEGSKVTGQNLETGTVIDRYGSPYGRYTSPDGTPYTQRSLPYVENPNAYHRYRVRKTIGGVTMGRIAPAFNQEGGGIQFELPSSILSLLQNNYLEEII